MLAVSHRRDHLRQLLPARANAKSTETLHQDLATCLPGEQLYLRNTQRDLNWLMQQQYAGREYRLGDQKKHYWFAKSRLLKLTLGPIEALHLSMIFEHAERFGMGLHAGELEQLKAYANKVMHDNTQRKIDWAKRITSATRFTMLRPGKVNADHLQVIQKALIDNEALKVLYRPRDADEQLCLYHLKPLGLSQQDSNLYLSCFVQEEQWPDGYVPDPGRRRGKFSSNGPKALCVLVLNRVVEVATANRIIADPPGYDIHSHAVRKDLLSVHSDTPIGLHLRISPNLHNRLTENQLTEDQLLAPAANGWWTLTGSIHDSQGLRLFLLSNAADIEVLAPATLRAHVRETLQRASTLYAQDPPCA